MAKNPANSWVDMVDIPIIYKGFYPPSQFGWPWDFKNHLSTAWIYGPRVTSRTPTLPPPGSQKGVATPSNRIHGKQKTPGNPTSPSSTKKVIMNISYYIVYTPSNLDQWIHLIHIIIIFTWSICLPKSGRCWRPNKTNYYAFSAFRLGSRPLIWFQDAFSWRVLHCLGSLGDRSKPNTNTQTAVGCTFFLGNTWCRSKTSTSF